MSLRYPICENKRLYMIYHGVKKRCYNPNEPSYKNYGARGIKMCEEWLRSFDSFVDWALSNGYKNPLSLERIDVDGDYSPDNCKWITMLEQSRNKRTTRWVTYKGVTKCLADWCDELDLPYDATHNRLDNGWDVDRAFNEHLFDQSQSIRQLCKERGLKYSSVLSRIKKLGWSREDALSIPTEGRKASREVYLARNILKNCIVCGSTFSPNSPKQKYCDDKCRQKSKTVAYKKNPDIFKIV